MVVSRPYRKNKSFGVSVGTAGCDAVSSADREKLFFQTTKSEMSGSPIPPRYRTKTMGLVSNSVSREYVPKVAPLPDRGFSTNMRLHNDKEFVDLEDNKAFFAMNKTPIQNVIPGLTVQGSGKSMPSSYAVHFPAHSKKQRKAACGDNQRPTEGHAVGCRGFNAAQTSTSHDFHKMSYVAPAAEKGFPQTNLAFRAGYTGHSLKSQYELDFRHGRQPSADAETMVREMRRSLSSPEFQKKLHPHLDMFGATRICGMDTGR